MSFDRREFLSALGAGAIVQPWTVPEWLPPMPEKFSAVPGTRIGLVTTGGECIAAQLLPPLVAIGRDAESVLLGLPKGRTEVLFPWDWLQEAGGVTVNRMVIAADIGPMTLRRLVPIRSTILNGGDLHLEFLKGFVTIS